jgi:hypothetical protein
MGGKKMIFPLVVGIMRMVHKTQNDECGEEEKSKFPCSRAF